MCPLATDVIQYPSVKPLPQAATPDSPKVASAPRWRRRAPDAEANARLTGTTGIVVLILFLIETVTVLLGVSNVLSLHITIGVLLAPPVLLKLASTTWRMVNYYKGTGVYVQRGAPTPLLRALGPLLGLLMLLLLASGLALAAGPGWAHDPALLVHNVAFYLTLAAIALHLTAHLPEAVRLTTRDMARRQRNLSPGARYRALAVLASLLAGALLALALAGHATPYLHHFPR
jgi:hypothetical protein